MGWKKGNVIMEALPYSHVIMQIYKEQRCNFCLTSSESLKRCASCKKIWYCQQQCQMDKSISKLDKSESPSIRVFNDLQSHSEIIKNDETRWDLFQIAADFIRAYTHGLFECPSEGTMLDIFGKMVINTFTLTDEMLQDVAVGVYNSPSILDHSCCPNAVASFQGRRLFIRMVKDLPSQNFSQVSLSYIDPLALTEERQGQLEQQYYFTCTCDRCKDSRLENLMTTMEDSHQDDVDRVKTCLVNLEEMTKDGADVRAQVEMCVECLSAVTLPETEIHLVRLLAKAFDAAIEAQMWQEASTFGKRRLSQHQALVDEDSPGSGLFYANLGKLLVFLEEVKEARPLLKKALKIFLVTLGDSHTLTRQVLELVQQCRMELGLTHS